MTYRIERFSTGYELSNFLKNVCKTFPETFYRPFDA